MFDRLTDMAVDTRHVLLSLIADEVLVTRELHSFGMDIEPSTLREELVAA